MIIAKIDVEFVVYNIKRITEATMGYKINKGEKTLYGMILITGLLLAGSEANQITTQILFNILGLNLFVIGGYFFVKECKKGGI